MSARPVSLCPAHGVVATMSSSGLSARNKSDADLVKEVAGICEENSVDLGFDLWGLGAKEREASCYIMERFNFLLKDFTLAEVVKVEAVGIRYTPKSTLSWLTLAYRILDWPQHL